MKKQHVNVNRPMPTVAMVGLCFALLAFVFTIVAASSMSFTVAFIGFAASIGATVLFGGVLLVWVRS